MKIKILKSKKGIEYALSEIKNNQLMYVDGGISTLFKKQNLVLCIVILYKNNQAIGCAITTENGAMFKIYNIAVYVKPNFRGLGYGKKLVEIVYQKTKKSFPSYIAYNSNPSFYEPIICKIK